MSNVTKLVPETDAIHQRFADADVIDLSLIDGWSELDAEQHRYLIEYAECFPKKTQTALRAGIPTSTMYRWFDNDTDFKNVANTIKNLYGESLHFVHFEEAKKNSKIRSQQLKALDVEGWKSEKKKQIENQQTNIFLGKDGSGLGALTKAFKKAEEAEVIED
ncbi:hypothetical protein ACKGJO_06885 [Gracilimonas sp. Q87]|uniref:hypothetical protein n=1 Tax=Gracilimonas sp. Q87 TaxID=3384766 RepID=UPI0039845F70